MTIGKFVDLVMPNEMKIARMLVRMLNDAETIALPKKYKIATYTRQKNILLASYFGMSNIKQIEAGITFDLVYENDNNYLRINHNVLIRVCNKYEWKLLMKFFDGNITVGTDKLVQEKRRAILRTFRKWRPIFAKHFGLSQPFSYTLLKHLRMLSMIRDNHAPELTVNSLFGFRTSIMGGLTPEQAQKSLLEHTKGVKYQEDEEDE